MTVLLVLSHFAAFIFGAVMWHAITVRKVDLVAAPAGRPRRGPTLGAVILVMVVASATLVGFGIQQSAFQKRLNERTDCIEDWGAEVVSTIDTRNAVTQNLNEAHRNRDDAVDEVLLILSNFVETPGYVAGEEFPPDVRQAFVESLLNFSRAKEALERAEVRAEVKRQNNPYPEMTCSR